MKIKQKYKKIILGLMALGLIGNLGLKKANASFENNPKREIRLDLRDPRMRGETNFNSAYSLNQITGKISDKFQDKTDKNILTRFGSSAAIFYFNRYIIYLSHESGHSQNDFKLSTKKFTTEGFFSKKPGNKKNRSLEERTYNAVGGFNQNTYNAEKLAFSKKNKLSFDEALFYLKNKSYPSRYFLIGGDDNTYSHRGGNGDYESYIKNCKKLERNVSKDKMAINYTIAMLGSRYTWDSVKAICKYLKEGKRSIKPSVIKLKNTGMSYPEFSYYPKAYSFIYKGDLIINPKSKHPIKVSLAYEDNDKWKNKIRFGGEYNYFQLTKRLNTSPFAYLNLEKGDYKGIFAGIEGKFNFNKNLGAMLNVSYNDNDMLENAEGLKKGINLRTGIYVNL